MSGGDRLSAPREAARRAFAWWWGEISAFVPPRAQAKPRARALVRVRAHETLVEADGHQPARLPPLEQLDRTAAEPLRELASTHEVAIALGEHDVHRLTLQLPRAARRHLDQAIGYHLGVASAVKPEELSYVALPQNLGNGQLEVKVALAKRRRLETITDSWSRLDLPPVPIGAARDGELELETVIIEARSTSAGDKQPVWLWGLFMVLLTVAPLAASAILDVAEARTRAALQRLDQDERPRIAALSDAAAAARLQQRLEQPLRSPRVGELVAYLARALPKEAWVDELSWREGHARIMVRGLSAAEVRPLLEARSAWRVVRADDIPGGAALVLKPRSA